MTICLAEDSYAEHEARMQQMQEVLVCKMAVEINIKVLIMVDVDNQTISKNHQAKIIPKI